MGMARRVTPWWLLMLVAAWVLPATSAGGQVDPCAGWEVRTLASGLGVLENLEFDRQGGLLLSSSDRDAVERMTPDGVVTTLVADVDRPGGMRVRDGILFVNTGNGAASGVLGTDDGTIQRIDLETGERTTWTTGLIMPNGLVFDGEGNAYVSRDLGPDGAITRIPPDGDRTPERFAEIADTNGLVISGDGQWLYAVSTFDPLASVWRIALDDPDDIERVATPAAEPGLGVPVVKGLDDMDIDGDDILYITAAGAGEVLRVDPHSGDACVLASGLVTPSATKFGVGPGWDPTHLYVVGFDGNVLELVAPSGAVTPRPDQDAPGSAEDGTGPADDPAAPVAQPPLPVTGLGGGLLALLVASAAAGVTGRRRVVPGPG